MLMPSEGYQFSAGFGHTNKSAFHGDVIMTCANLNRRTAWYELLRMFSTLPQGTFYANAFNLGMNWTQETDEAWGKSTGSNTNGNKLSNFPTNLEDDVKTIYLSRLPRILIGSNCSCTCLLHRHHSIIYYDIWFFDVFFHRHRSATSSGYTAIPNLCVRHLRTWSFSIFRMPLQTSNIIKLYQTYKLYISHIFTYQKWSNYINLPSLRRLGRDLHFEALEVNQATHCTNSLPHRFKGWQKSKNLKRCSNVQNA